MTTSLDRQAIVDEEHLRLLPVSYWVLGATSVFMALYGLLYMGMGVLFTQLPMDPSATDPPAALFFWMFFGMGAFFLLGFGTVAALQILSGFWIRQRRHRAVCLVTAGISCAFVPFGTLIGVFTFMTLLRPSVAELFQRQETPADWTQPEVRRP
ncbi:MAG TPA: hypothetical protein VLA05_09460 [Coriobacteriia bacterium]|nr:hypothetical protein [Coriobacteriia bacterium]